MKKTYFIVSICLTMLFAISSCKKEPGSGGSASIFGKVFVKDYNSTFTTFQGEYYGGDIYVYIIYGDDKDYSDKVKTSYDGTYEFKYLRPGKYQVYTFSKDSTLQTTNVIGVTQDVEITKRNQEVEVPDLVIFN